MNKVKMQAKIWEKFFIILIIKQEVYLEAPRNGQNLREIFNNQKNIT